MFIRRRWYAVALKVDLPLSRNFYVRKLSRGNVRKVLRKRKS